jgi:hypothetical protein
MAKRGATVLVPDEIITNHIYFIRSQKVMLDRDLARLYEVETKVLKQAVRRNVDRFPEDFMFELTKQENDPLRSQIVTLKRGQHDKYLPMAFTEQGVAMLSSVLNSKRAISINIQIIRIFTRLIKILADNTELRLEIERIKKKLHHHSKNIELVFQYLDELVEKKEKKTPRKKIGYLVKR